MKWVTASWAGRTASGKTEIWTLGNTDNGSHLGHVRWHGPWRKYCFFPAPDCIFEEDCLHDIAHFIEQQTRSHREVGKLLKLEVK